jgi:hypothetical protein
MVRIQGISNVPSAVARIRRKVEIIFLLCWDMRRRKTIGRINERIGDEYCRKERRICRNEKIGMR